MGRWRWFSVRATIVMAASLVAPALGPGAASASTLPEAPTLEWVAAGDQAVTLAWTPPATSAEEPIVDYRLSIYRGDQTTPLNTVRVYEQDRTVLRGLDDGKAYRFSLAAETAAGVGPTSERSEVVVPTITSPFADTDALVRASFTDFLDREPTADELAAWRTRANAGELDPAQVIEGVASLDESTVPAGRLTRLYLAYFRRFPDVGGYRFWNRHLRGGDSLLHVSNSFVRSSEFVRTYGHLDDRAFVGLVYQNVLGRAADPGGEAYWTRVLGRGRSRGWMMAAFSESSEYVRQTAETSTSLLFRMAMLRRTPTSDELEGDRAELRGAGRPVDLAFALLATAEYHARFGETLPGPSGFVWLRGTALGQVIVDGEGRFAYVADPGRSEVDVVDVRRRLAVGRIPVGEGLGGLDLSPDGSHLYVAAGGPSVVQDVDVATRQVVGQLPLPKVVGEAPTAVDVAVADTGVVVVTATVATQNRRPVLRVDPTTRATKVLATSVNARAVSACPGRTVVAVGDLAVYRPSSDQLAIAPTSLTAFGRDVACSADGERFIVGGVVLADATLHRDGELAISRPSSDSWGVLSPDGTRAYRLQHLAAPTLSVHDLGDRHRGQDLPLPEPVSDLAAGGLAITADGATLLVSSRTGLGIVPAPDEVDPAPTAAEPEPGSPLVPTAGRITDVAIGPDGATAWAVDTDRSTVEVVDLVTRRPVAAIPVDSFPKTIGFAADGSVAYVSGSGSAYVSVIDVATRAVVQRFLPQATSRPQELPGEVAVAADGTRLLASGDPRSTAGSIWTLDPTTGQAIESSRLAAYSGENHVTPTRDHHAVLVVTDAYNGKARWYDSATGTLGPVLDGLRHSSIAFDRTGQVGFTGFAVVDHDLQLSCVPPATDHPGMHGAVRDDGTRAFRLAGTVVQELDTATCEVIGEQATGDVSYVDLADTGQGAIAATDDGGTVAVATLHGLAIVTFPSA